MSTHTRKSNVHPLGSALCILESGSPTTLTNDVAHKGWLFVVVVGMIALQFKSQKNGVEVDSRLRPSGYFLTFGLDSAFGHR